MKKEDELLKELTDMVKETKKGQIKWKLSCQTTEYNDEAVKPTVTEDGIRVLAWQSIAPAPVRRCF